MGGCRCTYRNCTVRSDGKTHLFHYPVFDKVRCNQWLTNARRYDFLHLKVSQLKNRCICQHHFTDACFMNTMKDKLKVEAGPTIDGPFCDSSTFETPEVSQNTLVLYPIPREDIENDEYISDRKANYNLKYADFLTNCELIDPFKDTGKMNIDIEENNRNIAFHINKQEINLSSETEKWPSLITKEEETPATFVVNENISHFSTRKGKKQGKINIISEKKITEPEKKIPLQLSTGNFRKISPSMVLNLNKNPQKQINNKNIMNVTNDTTNMSKESTITEILSISDPSKFEIRVDIEEVNPQLPTIAYSQTEPAPENKVNSGSLTGPKVLDSNSTSKNKITPERLAAINEKRKFNMKLKDIIEAGLNQLDTQQDRQQGCAKTEIKGSSKKTLDSKTETVATSLSKELKSADNTDYIIAYFEARMKRMENLLLNKIDQNTQKIMELKRSFDPPEPVKQSSKLSTRNKHIHDEAHKKELYTEISKYLTPDANSLIYEELFINKYKPNVINDDCEPQSPKKRKRRIK